jgi:hypothetical protein
MPPLGHIPVLPRDESPVPRPVDVLGDAQVMDTLRAALSRAVFITIQGMTFPTWVRLLARNRFRVHPLYWPRAAVLTLTSLFNTVYAALDLLLFGWWVRRVPVRAPLVIIGHFRSGTTHLHNLLALDRSFAFPTLYETLNPEGFLSTEVLFRLPIRLLMTSHRPQDQVALDPTVPAEDEVAIGIMTLLSPYMGWVFPRRASAYDAYLSFHDVGEGDRKRWQRGLLWFLRKLTWKHGRPLILKSPTHTARIQMILELFPDARFVHIHRDPLEVFVSTRRLHTTLSPYFNLQRAGRDDLDERIFREYRRMYDAFFDQVDLIPPGQFCEVAFEDLDHDPVGTIARIYETLRLPGFDRVAPELRRYLTTLSTYQKNRYPVVPDALATRVASEWRRCYEAWGYASPAAPAGATPHTRRTRTPAA